MAHGTCVECFAEDRHLPGRSLCSGCYDRRWRAGTLDEFPVRPRPVVPPRTEKSCPICKVTKPLDQFPVSSKRFDGRGSYCNPCRKDTYGAAALARGRKVEPFWDGSKVCWACDTEQPLTEFLWERGKGRHSHRCKLCRSAAEKAKHEADPTVRRDRNLRANYGITLEQYNKMLADQGGVCWICSREPLENRALAVDHDHSCCPGGKSCGACLRKLLCENCNRGIGLFADDPIRLMRAAEYLGGAIPE